MWPFQCWLNAWVLMSSHHCHHCGWNSTSSSLPPLWDFLLKALASYSLPRPVYLQPSPWPRTQGKSHMDFRMSSTEPFLLFQLCPSNSTCFSISEFDLYCSAHWDCHTLLGFHLPMPSLGAVGLISSVLRFRACSPHCLLFISSRSCGVYFVQFCTYLWWEGTFCTIHHSQRQKTLSLHDTCWNSDA